MNVNVQGVALFAIGALVGYAVVCQAMRGKPIV